jgi:hypothetical protein
VSIAYEAAAREAEGKPVTFGLGGAKFSTKLPAEIDGFVVMELAKVGVERGDMDDDDEDGGMEVLASFYEFFDGILAPAEFRRFRKVARRHGVPLDVLMTIAKDIMPLLFGRPTSPSAGSAASPMANGRSSTDGATSQGPAASTG